MNTYGIYATRRFLLPGETIRIEFSLVSAILAQSAEDALAIAKDLGHREPVIGAAPSLQ